MKARTVLKALAGLSMAMAMTNSWSQPRYPERPVRVIVALPAGGSVDMVARVLSQKLSQNLGQTFVVDNKPGGSGIIGTDMAAKAAPDGYTLTIAPTAWIASNVSMFKKLPYDPVSDFVPVAQIVSQPFVLVVRPTMPVSSVKDLVDFGLKNPGKLNYGSGGDGSPHHFAGVMFAQTTKIQMEHISYKGGSPAMADLLAGQIDMIFAPVPEAMQHVKAGRLKALAVYGDKPSAVLPGVPTMKQAGFEGMTLVSWIGLLAPKATPAPIVQMLNAEIQKVLQGPDGAEFSAIGLEPTLTSPAQFNSVIQSDIATYAELMRRAGMQPQ